MICLTLVILVKAEEMPPHSCHPAIPSRRVFLLVSLVLSPSSTETKEFRINKYFSFCQILSLREIVIGMVWVWHRISPNLKKVGDNYFSIFTLWLHHMLEMVMAYPDNLGKPLGPHCKRLWDIENNSYFSCHICSS